MEPEQGSGPQPEPLRSLIFANNKKTIWINLNHLVLLCQDHANSFSSTSRFPPPPPKDLGNAAGFHANDLPGAGKKQMFIFPSKVPDGLYLLA